MEQRLEGRQQSHIRRGPVRPGQSFQPLRHGLSQSQSLGGASVGLNRRPRTVGWQIQYWRRSLKPLPPVRPESFTFRAGQRLGLLTHIVGVLRL